MAKVKTIFFCKNCGADSPKWVGKCPSCGEWNTFSEEVVSKSSSSASKVFGGRDTKPASSQHIREIVVSEERRIQLADQELSRVLGGGLVPGSLTLLGGEPGIGKSTLMLQLALGNKGLKTLYVSGEESQQQIKMRADRLGLSDTDCFVLTETSMQNILKNLKEIQPDFVVVDSVQTLHTVQVESSPGSIVQIRECTGELLRFAKQTGVPVFLIGHITKDGALAGPKVLEHMVDAVLQFEGDRNHVFRLLRSLKNRFGSTNELGIYAMQGSGLQGVDNPSEILISNKDDSLSGIAIAASIDGARPMLIEVQALVSTSAYGMPQRTATGFDLRRMNMLLAVLEKRCGFKLGAKDVFLNLAGGLRVDDPAIDLALVCAVLSSNVDIPVDTKTCFAAEVGLSGEIRPVSRIDQRIGEADKLGYERIFVSQYNKGLNNAQYGIKLVQVKRIDEVFRALFAG